MKIAVASFSNETCTFCPEPTKIEHLEPNVLRGEEVFEKARGIPVYINGYLEAAKEENDVNLVPIVAAGSTKGGFRSWFDKEAFDKYADEIVKGIKEQMPLDGVLLALHGAMAVTDVPKPEAELARRVREVVGDDTPIMVTFDLHANEDHEIVDATDGVFVIKTYPHIDSYETGYSAAKCLFETIRGNVNPTQAILKPGIVSASIFQGSAYHPMNKIYAKCAEWEQRDDVIRVDCAPGYAYADVVDIGMSIFAMTDNNKELAEKIVKEIGELAWSLREDLNRDLPKTEEAVRQVIQLVEEGKGPVLVADGADRTGDSTHVLKELIKQGAKNFALPGIADPKAAKFIEENHKVGDHIEIEIGGYASEYSGTPVKVKGEITYMGRPSYKLVGPMRKGMEIQDDFVAVINLGNNSHVVVSERMRGANDSSPFTAVGIDYKTLDIIVLKDRVHHRAYWDDVVNIDFPIDAPGIGAVDLLSLEFENAPDDAYPIGKNYR
jgi:microcystin degradation protein MlrC